MITEDSDDTDVGTNHNERVDKNGIKHVFGESSNPVDEGRSYDDEGADYDDFTNERWNNNDVVNFKCEQWSMGLRRGWGE